MTAFGVLLLSYLLSGCIRTSTGFCPAAPSSSSSFETRSISKKIGKNRFLLLQAAYDSHNARSEATSRKRNYQEGGNQGVSKNKSVSRHRFQQYLRKLSNEIRNKRTLANRMDDELKTMEINFYGLDVDKGDETMRCRYPDSVSYNGPVVAPDVRCYAMVASAYAKSRLGETGAELAEQVLRRCEKYSTFTKPNVILKTACLNAWIQAGDWDKADRWLFDIEQRYNITGERIDAPDTILYTHYLEGLASTKSLSPNQIISRCDKILQKMHALAESRENPYASPNSFTYLAAMKARSRRRQSANKNENWATIVEEVEALLRELQERYQAAGKGDPKLKPNAHCYIPVANAAARSRGGIEAARYAESLLRELEHLYLETGDPDYRPLDGIYTACFTAYARVEKEHATEAAQRVRLLLQELGEEEKTGRRALSIQAYTAAMNGLIVDDTPENLKEAEDILKRLPYPDSIAYQCGEFRMPFCRAHISLIVRDKRGAPPTCVTQLLSCHAKSQCYSHQSVC
jgi:flagellin-specific chaperone FliS